MHSLVIALLLTGAPAPGRLARTLDVVNAGSETIYALRIGHRLSGEWSDDVLDFQVIDVGTQRRLPVLLESTCWYDVQASYRDGHVAEIDDVDLCKPHRIFLTH